VSDRIPVLRLGDTLLVSLQRDLHDAAALAFQEDVLVKLERTGARGLLIDISGLDMVDSYVAQLLAKTARMTRLMGARAIIVGMRPMVAATLVRMGAFIEDVETALNLDEGLKRLRQR
jgi:rsbT antagonist protein RsbS